VKSRIRTPSSALPAWPQGFAEGRGAPFAPAVLAADAALSLTVFFPDFFAAIVLFVGTGLLAAFLVFLLVLPARFAITVLLNLASGRNLRR
jgi:hypothetical protein